jgi:hypothetical protein
MPNTTRGDFVLFTAREEASVQAKLSNKLHKVKVEVEALSLKESGSSFLTLSHRTNATKRPAKTLGATLRGVIPILVTGYWTT